MKLTLTAIAAIFSLLVLMAPGNASADTGNWHQPAVQQVGFFTGRPLACHNRYFRHHHRYLCR
jgi:hypothetical protein